MRNRTRVALKGQLLGQVWGYDADDHLLEVHLSSLHRKLEARRNPRARPDLGLTKAVKKLLAS